MTAFGLRTLAGTDDRFRFTGFTSAGPTPKEYPQLVAAVDEAVRQADENPLWLEVRRRLRELPKHSLAKTLGLAVPNFFDCVWEASGSESGHNPPQPSALFKIARATFLKAPAKCCFLNPTGFPTTLLYGFENETGTHLGAPESSDLLAPVFVHWTTPSFAPLSSIRSNTCA